MSLNKTILLTGANGQLAREFQIILSKKGIEYASFPREKLDITNFKEIEAITKEVKPDILINCAAYNLVDEAEESPYLAYAVNRDGVKNLALLSARFNIFLVHFSTDYIFDGEKKDFYVEGDLPHPINKYGESKLEGEEEVKKNLKDFLIFRVSWVIGRGKRNFLYKIFNWSKEKHILKISCDEVSVPTYTEDIANITFLALNKGLKGIYHLTNSGYCSRYEFAKYFIKKMRLDNLLIPVPANIFNTPAKRPVFSAMSNTKISRELNISIPEWENGVERFARIFKEESL